MNIESCRESCLCNPLATEDTPFDETTLVIRVMNKIFACLDMERPDLVVLKCEPSYAIELRDRYSAVEGAWHWNKKYWNQIYFHGDVDDSLLCSLIDHSYNEVVKKMPKKTQEIIRNANNQNH